jgi:hypothetical protein
MNNEILEQRLRQPLEKATPRPGFETRLQAMAHHELKPTRSDRVRSRLWLTLPTFALLFLLAIIAAPEKDQIPPVAKAPAPIVEVQPAFTLIKPSALKDEARGIENDARRTADFLFKAMPSISFTKKER